MRTQRGWYELLISLPPIDLEECHRQQQLAKRKLLDERDKTHLQQYFELKEAGDECNHLAACELNMWLKTVSLPPRWRNLG